MPKPRLSGSASVLPPLQECFRGCGRGQAQVMVEVQDPRKKTQAARGAWYLGNLQRVWLESEPISKCHLLPVRMLFPSPKACSPCKPPPPRGGSQGPCDSLGNWQSVERQRLLCWIALSCQELQGFSAVAGCVSSQQLWGRLCND